jgi:hypothetical protein
MNQYFDEQFMLTTVMEIDTSLTRLLQRVSKDRFLEIGDDPQLVRDLEQEILYVSKQIRKLAGYFDLSVVPLSKANHYYVAASRIGNMLEYIHEIKLRDCGSIQHTRQVQAKLTECVDSVRQIGDLIQMYSDILQ